MRDEGSCKISITEISNRIEAHRFVRVKLANCYRKALVIWFPIASGGEYINVREVPRSRCW